MLCQQCKKRTANIQLNVQINQKKQKLHLCEECYQKLGNGMSVPFGFGPLGGISSMSDMFFREFPFVSGGKPDQSEMPGVRQSTGILEEVGRDLSHAARAGLIDPVIGRDEEVERVIEILNRRNKNNPVLIGEPGVGKTAIAEGLALRIAEGKVPAKLLNKVVFTLDVSSLVAGTGIRGQFEEKIKQVIAELQQRKNVILFIDEIHLLVGAGSAQGSIDAGNILKPALARGELQVIGATTLKEYRLIEKDAALERRFQPVIVKEPSLEEAFEILKGIRSKYEAFHNVRYSDEVLRACVGLSHRYIPDRFLPDKAIDLLDEAGSKVNLRSAASHADEIRRKCEQAAAEKEKATKREDYESAAKWRDEELALQAQLQAAEEAAQPDVSVEDIQEIIEIKTGIPVRKLQQAEQQKMKHLPERLSQRIIGQPEAVEKVAKAIRRSRAGLKPKNRPIASFLFVGPTGVGKTELSKCLAEELFGTRDAMIRLDMSEYMEKHSVSKLIGSPPGYVGHEEAGQLTERVRRNPYSIVLVDEIEKAHPDVQHIFLQILDDGRLTDSQGRTVSFQDTVIIMTSNAGMAEKKNPLGFNGQAPKARPVSESLGAYFKPEFLNRFDGIIPFQHLTEDDLLKIVDLMLDDVVQSVKEQGIELQVTNAAKRRLAELGYNPSFGARPLRRVIQEYVEDGIADLIMEEDAISMIKVDASEDRIAVEKVK
jgi:ATP-dependent Clp protease ATP-binding subunit ClpE